MKTKTRNTLITILTLAAASTAATALLNKYLKTSAIAKDVLPKEDTDIFKWRLGDVCYTKRGSGKPLLLIHSLNALASGEEWAKLGDFLAGRFTLYTVDLLGCGRSEKPDITYTSYLYSQLICDFVRSVIGRRCAVIASGGSASVMFCACAAEPDLFDGLMAVNPESITEAARVPSHLARLYKRLIDAPVIGTLIYNIAVSRPLIRDVLLKDGFYNHAFLTPVLIDSLSESAHLGASPKAVFSSVRCCYARTAIDGAVKKIDNSIYIAGGEYAKGMDGTMREFKECNPAIETFTIDKTRGLPQLEAPYELSEIIKACLL